MVYLLKYDSAHRTLKADVSHDGKNLLVNNHTIKVFGEMDPKLINWSESGVETVLECTGKFLTEEKTKAHLSHGVKKVIISAPAKDDTPMFVFGVNHKNYKGQSIISNASCTTNCVAT